MRKILCFLLGHNPIKYYFPAYFGERSPDGAVGYQCGRCLQDIKIEKNEKNTN